MTCPKITWKQTKQCLRQNWLIIATAGCAILAVIIGIIINASVHQEITKRQAMYVGFIGKLFLNALKSIIVPLIVSSIIVAVGTLDLSLSVKIGARAIIYYLSTTILAITLGISMVLIIKPGKGVDLGDTEDSHAATPRLTVDNLLDLIASCFPPNIIQATMQQLETKLIVPKNETDKNSSKETWDFDRDQPRDSTNVLGLVVWSVIIGTAISFLGDAGKPVLKFTVAFLDIMMVVTNAIIALTPLGIFFIVLEKIVEVNDVGDMFKGLGAYFGTVLLCIFIHGFIVIPSIYGIIVRKLPFRFLANMGLAMMTAFGTASSSATLPVTIKCLEEKNNIDPRVVRFVAPIGATINMDGTALYEAIAALFVAQVRAVDYTAAQVIGVSMTATMGSIGAAGIPQSGIVTIIMVLEMVGLPSEDVGLILSVDWLLDRFRTTINVLGDAFGAGIVDHLSKDELKKMDEAETLAKTEESRESSEESLNRYSVVYIKPNDQERPRRSGGSNDDDEHKSNQIRRMFRKDD